MKKKQTKIIVAVISVLIMLGIGLGVKKHMDDKAFKVEMIKIATSDEAKKLYRDELKKFEKDAYSSDGIIKSYQIDTKSIKHNPMGGIDLILFINDDDKLYVYVSLNKSSNKMEAGVSGCSTKLDNLLRKNKER